MLLRAIRWRLGSSLLTVLVAAIAVGTSMLGPLYLRAAGDSLVRSAVAAAPVESDGLLLSAAQSAQVSVSQFRAEQQALNRRFDLDRWYGPALTTVSSPLSLTGPGSQTWGGQLLYRQGICGHITMQTGSCRLGPGQVLVSARTARTLDLAVGSTIRTQVVGAAQPLSLRVAGIYTTPNLELSYWWGNGREYFAYGLSGPHQSPQADAFIATEATALKVPVADMALVTVQLPLRMNAVGLPQSGAIEQVIAKTKTAAQINNVTASSVLPQVLATATSQQHQMTTIVAVAAIQLVLLAVWVLAALLLRSADLRRAELRVARLRGFPFVSVLAVTVVEPAILCLIGAVIGIAGAWGAILIAKDALLYRTATMSVGPWVIAALAASLLTIAGVLSASALRVLRVPASDQISASVTPATGRGRVIVDAGLLVLSIVSLLALATSGALANHGNPIASAAPGLLALGTAAVAIRLVLWICRRITPPAARAGKVSLLLALRQVVRRPAVIRQGQVLVVAICLACFSVCAWSAARSNRQTAAEFTVGAPTVVTVTPGKLALQQAVAKADPTGRYAMAAIQITTASSNLIAVDASRLAAVAAWPRGITHAGITAVSRALQPRTNPQINLPVGTVSLDVTTAASTASARLRNLDLELWVFNPRIGTTIVPLGAVSAGSHRYTGSLADWCPGGCRLSGIGLAQVGSKRGPGGGTINLTLTRIAMSSSAPKSNAAPESSSAPTSSIATAVTADLTPGGWRSSADGVQVSSHAGGLVVTVPDSALAAYQGTLLGTITRPMASVADYPVNIPGVATTSAIDTGTQSGATTVLSSQGIDGNSVSIASVMPATALPRAGNNAELVDLGLLTREEVSPPLSITATQEVWLGTQAPKDALAKLRAAGLTIDNVQRAANVDARLQQSGPAFAYDFMLFATIVALLVAAASTLGVLGSGIRQRAAELTALQVAGVGRSRIVRSLVFEAGILALTALFGAAAGAVGAAMAIPSLPQLGGASFAPLSYTLPAAAIIAVTACAVMLVAIVTTVTGAAIVRQMSPAMLRNAPTDTHG